MYENGLGVSQDYTEAVNWYTKAAEQGWTDAQLNLGLMYAYGRGMPTNFITAYVWESIAAESGSENALNSRDLIAAELTPENIKKAQERATKMLEVIEKRRAQ